MCVFFYLTFWFPDRDFVAHYVENTNLILVITEAEKDGCDKCKLSVDPKDLIQEPVEPSAAEG